MSHPPNSKHDPLAGWSHSEPPFHTGERELQARYGLAERLAQVGRRVMREGMPEEHREFLEELSFVLVGSVDEAQRPWASLLSGEPGFLGSPDATTLIVNAAPSAGDPLATQLQVGSKLGMLGIQFDTRRRNRVNGHVSCVGQHGFSLAVEQSFGNCPKYIHRRRSKLVHENPAGLGQVKAEGALLSERARDLIAQADTFFIASASPQPQAAHDPARGADVSHRGGPPGFVRLENRTSPRARERKEESIGDVLRIPDYSGNYFFNTFGNLLLHPYAGLLFQDFEDGTLLQLTVATELILDGPELEQEQGAERMLRFRVERGFLLERASPLRFQKL
jgi:predicted pyridoxine 5'-phosphate oxidase superfamily flavin-nucleotide-binding protein